MRFLTVARFEYLRRIRSKWFIISTFGMPVLILGFSLISGYLAGSGATLDTKEFALMDETDYYGALLVDAIEGRYADDEIPPITIMPVEGSFDVLKDSYDQLVTEGMLDGYFVIPPDFEESTQIRNYAKSSSSLRLTDIVESRMQAILVQERARTHQVPDEIVDALRANVEMVYYEIATEEEMGEAEIIASYIAPFIFMFLLFMGIFTGAQLLMRAVLEERSSRVMEILLSTLSHQQLMMGKIMGLGFLGLTQSAIYLAVVYFASLYYEVSILTGTMTVLYLAYFILGYLWFASMFIGVGALFDSEQEAQQAIQIISFLAVIPMMLWMLVIESPNSLLVNILSYVPPLTPFFMIIKIAVKETNGIQIAGTLLVLLATVYVSIRISAKVFRTAVLLYGKRITFQEIVRWIRA